MKGWLLVGPEATKTAAGFKSWVDFALAWTARAKEPPKPAKKRAKGTARKVARRA